MSTTLFKKLFVYWCILIGLGGFGFAQNGCNTDNDCSVKKVQSCCWEWILYQCSNEKKEWWPNPYCAVIECISKKPSTLKNKITIILTKPAKYNIKYDCKCQQYQCKDVSAGESINPLWIRYIAIKVLILSIWSISLWCVGYYIYERQKNKRTQI